MATVSLQYSQNFVLKEKRDHGKNFVRAPRLWVGGR